jgi:hypothetical protein
MNLKFEKKLLNMFRALLCPSSGAFSNCIHIYLGIHTETGGCDCRLKELLMMGMIMPETC